MKKKNVKTYLGFVLLLFFIVAQMSVFVHAAEHGTLEHTHHDEEQCEQFTFAKHYNANIPETEPNKLYVTYSETLVESSPKTIVVFDIPNTNLARAPPLFS